MLAEVSAVELSARQIETIAESLGAAAEQRQLQEQQQAATQGLGESRGPQPGARRTFIIEMDGVQMSLQDGSWQEVKCGVIYELSQRVEIQAGRWELLQRQRCARWSEDGGDAILALRSFVLNDRLDELCPKPTISLDWAAAA